MIYCYALCFRKGNKTHLFCVSPSHNESQSVHAYVDSVSSLLDFTYKPNPNITAIERVEVFIRSVKVCCLAFLFLFYAVSTSQCGMQPYNTSIEYLILLE